jgi:hypothetical protein
MPLVAVAAAEVSSTEVLDRPASNSSCQSKTNVRILLLKTSTKAIDLTEEPAVALI